MDLLKAAHKRLNSFVIQQKLALNVKMKDDIIDKASHLVESVSVEPRTGVDNVIIGIGYKALHKGKGLSF